MPPHENIAAMQRAWARLRVRDLDGYLALYSESVIHHGYSSRIRPGVRGLKDHYTSLLKGFPDLRVEVDDIIAEDEKVAHRFTFTEHIGASSWEFRPRESRFRLAEYKSIFSPVPGASKFGRCMTAIDSWHKSAPCLSFATGCGMSLLRLAGEQGYPNSPLKA